MKARYCRTHFIADAGHEPRPSVCWLSLATQNALACNFVEMQLVPADALVIEKVNGEWPKRVLEILRYDVATLAEAEPAEILDALAEAQP